MKRIIAHFSVIAFFVFILFIGINSISFAAEKVATEKVTTSVTKTTVTSSVADKPDVTMLDQLGRGFSNMVYALFELPYQLKEEIKRTDPVQGLLPGVIKGVFWTGMREVVGVFEVVTFVAPSEPIIKNFDTDWLTA